MHSDYKRAHTHVRTHTRTYSKSEFSNSVGREAANPSDCTNLVFFFINNAITYN